MLEYTQSLIYWFALNSILIKKKDFFCAFTKLFSGIKHQIIVNNFLLKCFYVKKLFILEDGHNL